MRRTAGFTIIELVVALAVSGIVVVSAHEALVTVADARARAEETRVRVTRAAGARALLTTWLRAAVVDSAESAFGETVTRGGGERTESLTFRVSHGGSLYPGSRLIRLWVDPGSTGGSRGLLAEVSPRSGAWNGPDTLSLEPQAGSMRVRYWGSVEGADRWIDAWPSEGALPRVVEVQLGARIRVRLGPDGVVETDDLSSLMALPIVVPVGLAAW